ncbi:MAG: conjugal transfer protein TraB [Sphingobacteriaceae bacterium]|nr:MAG: conjugal transfer protein TraB [Sphingobacteriaceae bacterium]
MINKLKNIFAKKDSFIDDRTDKSTASVSSIESNNSVLFKQNKTLFIGVLVAAIGVLLLMITFKSNRTTTASVEESPKLKVEVAAEGLDMAKMWHNHFEDKLRQSQQAFEDRLKIAEENFAKREQELVESNKIENEQIQTKLKFAKEELNSAAAELSRVNDLQRSNLVNHDGNSNNKGTANTNISAITLGSTIEFDKPKSSKVYVPETTYLTGYLLTGLTLSTGMSASSNPTSGVIVITGRGNLAKNFKVDVTTCRIMCSAYGDLSSERANIRLESMICTDPKDGLITRSEIAGYVQGPDNGSGIKGRVVATSSRHIKNAMLGGLVSGLASTAKGQDPMTITSFGTIDTKKKGIAQVAQGGLFSGASNAAEKLADYHLKQAEAMSPVLTVPGGVKIEMVFTKGFFFGQQGTHKKIEQLRQDNRGQEQASNQSREVSSEEQYQ